jgi:hypothetical protein
MNENIFSESFVGVPKELDIFEPAVVQTAIEKVFYVDYRPTNQISTQDAPIFFSIGSESRHYIDLSKTLLYAKVRLLKEDGEDVPKDTLVCPINSILQSLWSQCDVKISGRSLSMSHNCYALKAYILQLLGASETVKKSALSAQSFFLDNGDLDKISSNSGALKRAKRFSESNSVELIGTLLEDICLNQKLILNNTGIEIKLFRNRPEFIILTETDDKFKIEIQDICLKVCYVSVNPAVIAGHAEALKKSPAIYPFNRAEIKSFNLPSGSRQFTFDNIFNNSSPNKCYIVFIDSEAFSGDFKKNPFNFAAHNLCEIELSVDGQAAPTRAMKFTIDSQGRQATLPFIRLHECIKSGGTCHHTGNGITLEQFANGFAVYSFDIHGMSNGGNVMEIRRSANVRIQGTFSKALTSAVTCVVYGEFPAVMTIDETRNVTVI